MLHNYRNSSVHFDFQLKIMTKIKRILKLFLCLINHRNLRRQGGIEVKLHAFLMLALHESECLASPPRSFPTSIPLDTRLAVQLSWSGRCLEEKNSYPSRNWTTIPRQLVANLLYRLSYSGCNYDKALNKLLTTITLQSLTFFVLLTFPSVFIKLLCGRPNSTGNPRCNMCICSGSIDHYLTTQYQLQMLCSVERNACINDVHTCM
jgi:hypothetical protein